MSRLPSDEFRWVNLDGVHQDPGVASVVKDADHWLPGGLQGLPPLGTRTWTTFPACSDRPTVVQRKPSSSQSRSSEQLHRSALRPFVSSAIPLHVFATR